MGVLKALENAEKLCFKSEAYGFPILSPADVQQHDFVGFNYARSCKDPANVGVHFFLDDYQFVRVWSDPLRYANMLSRFRCVMTPDFSMYLDMPVILQMYNHYRKQWLGAYWQSMLIDVIPTVSWSDESSFSWCFSGIPTHSTVAISSVGTQRGKESKRMFLAGYNAMVDKLCPSTILFYGNVPKECTGNIIRIPCYQEKFTKMEGDINGR